MGIPGICKTKTREALKGNWLTALLIALTVNLPSLLVQGIASFTGNDVTTRLFQLLAASMYTDGSAADQERMISGMREIAQSGGIWAMQGLNLVAFLIMPCLSLGMLAWLLGRLRKETDPGVPAVFSRVKLFFPAIGLRLYTLWKVFLWMLPGIALSVAGIAALTLIPVESEDAVWVAVSAYLLLEMGAMALMLVLGVRAALKYALGNVILADHPDMGPVQAAKESLRIVMQGRRGSLFGLYMSFAGWYALVIFSSMLGGETPPGSIIGLMVQMLGSLALSVYMNGAICAFYLGIGDPGEAPAEKPAGAEDAPLGEEERDQNPWEK